MKLDTFLKSKIRWHLGYNTTSIPAGDLARLEEALDNVPDSFWYSKIVEQIERCDEAEKRTDMTGTMNYSTVPRGRVESIAGDEDRTIATTDFKETLKTWTQIYLYETDRLALHLYVPNYRNPEQAHTIQLPMPLHKPAVELPQAAKKVCALDAQPSPQQMQGGHGCAKPTLSLPAKSVCL